MKISQICLSLLLLCVYGAVLAQETQLTQTIRGKVSDKESMSAIPGATIILVGSEPLKGSTTDAEGYFRIEKVPVGRHSLKITSVGYEEQMLSELLIGSGKELILNITLEESLIQMEEIVIVAEQQKGKAQNDLALLSSRSISPEETKRYAASVNDPARAVLSFAGVATTDDVRNEIVVRGNSPRGILWRLEGVEIPNPNHFADDGASGGAISILSVNTIDNSDFFTGGFPAEYGNALSGVFDIKLRIGNNEKREFAFQAGVLGIDAAVEGPFSKNGKGSYLFNYRYSTLAVLNGIGLKLAGDATPDFQDFSYKFHIPTKSAGAFSLWGIGGLSKQKTFAEKDSLSWESRFDRMDEQYRSGMAAFGLSHIIFLDKNTYLQSVVSGSGNLYKYENDTLNKNYEPIDNFKERFSNRAVRATFMLNRKFNANHTVRVGYNQSFLFYDLLSQARDRQMNNQFVTYVSNNGNSSLIQSYIQWKYRINNSFTLQSGFHYNHLVLNGSNSLEPRFGLRYEISQKSSLTFSYGHHTRHESMGFYLAQKQLPDGSVSYPNRNLNFTKARHYVIAYEQMLSEDIRIKAEAYYQDLYNVPISASINSSMSVLNFNSGFTTEQLVNKGKGRNYGIEVTGEKFFTKGYYILATTSLYQSKYTVLDGIERNTRFNGNRLVNVTGGKEFKVGKNKNNLISLNGKIIWAGGNRYTPVDLQRSIEEGKGIYINEEAYSLQVPDYFRTDIRFSYRKNRPKASFIISLDLQNATNRLNVYSKFYDEDKQEMRTYYQTGLIPILNYRIEF
jgi:hypothetical protein